MMLDTSKDANAFSNVFYSLTTELNSNLKQFASCAEKLNLYLKESNLDFTKVL